MTDRKPFLRHLPEQFLDRLLVGAIALRQFTFMGYQPNPTLFLQASVPQMITMMQADQVDAALLVPV